MDTAWQLYQNMEKIYTLVKLLNARNGVGTNFINNMLFDRGLVWLLCENSLLKITNVLERDPVIDILVNDDGLPKDMAIACNITMNTEGYIYVSGPTSVVRFHRDSLFKANTGQKTHIIRIDLNNKELKWSAKDGTLSFSGIPAHSIFEHDQNAFDFHFTGVNFSNPNRVKYQYMLQGYRPDTLVTAADYVSFNNLPPGDYTFKVRSTANAQFSSEQFAVFAFTIKVPYWQSWWFRSLCILGIASLIYAFFSPGDLT